jgi:hypothetical protein
MATGELAGSPERLTGERADKRMRLSSSPRKSYLRIENFIRQFQIFLV